MTAHAGALAEDKGQTLDKICRERTASEAAHLEALRSRLLSVREALTTAEPDRLAAALLEARTAAGALVPLHRERQEFRQQAGAILGIPPAAVTLAKAADALPPALAAPLRQARERLRQMAADIDRINKGNSLVIWWRLDFIHQVFAGIPGLSSSGRYSPGGRVQAPVCGSLWQGNG